MEEISLILVDGFDRETGLAGKTEVHRKGLLHRAVSVFVFNSKGQWLLQRRALEKYHSGGLWTNTCCTHPLPGESNIDAAGRRLTEEMGMKCELREMFSFTYREELDKGMIEHEFDHVFAGISDDDPNINPDEVAEFQYVDFVDLQNDVDRFPGKYTVWFKKIFERVQDTAGPVIQQMISEQNQAVEKSHRSNH